MADDTHYHTEGAQPENDPATLDSAPTQGLAHAPVTDQAERNAEHTEHFSREQTPPRQCSFDSCNGGISLWRIL